MEAVRIIDTSDDEFSRARSDLWYCHQPLNPWIAFADGVELLCDEFEVNRQRIELCELDIEFRIPKIVWGAFC